MAVNPRNASRRSMPSSRTTKIMLVTTAQSSAARRRIRVVGRDAGRHRVQHGGDGKVVSVERIGEDENGDGQRRDATEE